jgi:hypothetical protein
VFFLKDNLENIGDVDVEFVNKTYTSNYECLNFLENEAEYSFLRNFIEVFQLFISNTWNNVELLDFFPSLP